VLFTGYDGYNRGGCILRALYARLCDGSAADWSHPITNIKMQYMLYTYNVHCVWRTLAQGSCGGREEEGGEGASECPLGSYDTNRQGRRSRKEKCSSSAGSITSSADSISSSADSISPNSISSIADSIAPNVQKTRGTRRKANATMSSERMGDRTRGLKC
jgi:hypothetical protein